ncbi:hypothetical protein EYF80_060203 [Liparis tanakae]|uniref:Uncharacterized protein n=1 Tax=Liparis tanakae TaxID=230148 RepID=A0A4Z2ELH5_9TELE|nr:hypothetical protein EYF80_060203 [Liparis tanakae]
MNRTESRLFVARRLMFDLGGIRSVMSAHSETSTCPSMPKHLLHRFTSRPPEPGASPPDHLNQGIHLQTTTTRGFTSRPPEPGASPSDHLNQGLHLQTT